VLCDADGMGRTSLTALACKYIRLQLFEWDSATEDECNPHFVLKIKTQITNTKQEEGKNCT
jgi:hypothetical protein